MSGCSYSWNGRWLQLRTRGSGVTWPKQSNEWKHRDACGLVAELLTYVPEDVLTKLLALMNDLLLSGELPPTWQKTVFQMLPKTTKAMVTSDYLPIANVRVYLVLGRIKNTLDYAQPEEQHGFRKNRRIEEHLMTANYVFDKTTLVGTPFWFISLDLSKGFDRIDWQALWAALETHGVSQHLVWILQLLYDNQRGQVFTDSGESRELDIRRGMKQGCVLSPRLFCSVLEDTCEKGRGRFRRWGPTLAWSEVCGRHFGLCYIIATGSIVCTYNVFAFHFLCPKWAAARHTGSKSKSKVMNLWLHWQTSIWFRTKTKRSY